MRQLLLAFFLCAVACTEPSVDPRVTLIERTGFEPDGGSSSVLATSWQGFQVTTSSSLESQLGVIRASDGGGSMVRLRRSTRPAGNGGQLQQMSFERVDFGSPGPAADVAYPPTTFCGGAMDCPASYAAEMAAPKVSRDGSLLMAVRLGSASPPAVFTPQLRLLRFASDGGLVLNAGIVTAAPVSEALATELGGGPVLVSYSKGSGASSLGVAFELRSPETGAVTSSVSLDSTDIPDSGIGLVARSVPIVAKLVPTRSGGFLAVGQVFLSRDIMCGTQDDPKPGGCGQSITHAMLVKFDEAGKLLWRRDLGREFVQPGSFFVDAAELDDGSIVATGQIEKPTGRWLEPELGSLVARFSAEGAITRVTRFCPCTLFPKGGRDALAVNPRAVSGGYEVLFRDGRGGVIATRFASDDVLLAAEELPRKGEGQQFVTTSSGWAFFLDPRQGVTELNHVEFRSR